MHSMHEVDFIGVHVCLCVCVHVCVKKIKIDNWYTVRTKKFKTSWFCWVGRSNMSIFPPKLQKAMWTWETINC